MRARCSFVKAHDVRSGKVRRAHPNREIRFAGGATVAFAAVKGDGGDRSVEMKAKGFLSPAGLIGPTILAQDL